MDEVFQRQSADVQDFLLKTSILDRLTAPLCDAVAERDDSRKVILALGRANLFVVPLDQSREWYRYHHLFADLLRHRLLVESRTMWASYTSGPASGTRKTAYLPMPSGTRWLRPIGSERLVSL